MSKEQSVFARRSFLAKAGIGAAAGAIAAGATNAFAQAPASGSAPFQPARHAEDDWLEKSGVKHRLCLDATSANGFGEALLFASNFFGANKSGYGVDADQLAVVIVARHNATAFAYTDEIWAKYGKALADRAQFTDPKTKEAPIVNVYRASGYGAQLSSLGTTLDAVVRQGALFGVCQLSTRANAGVIARQTGGNTNDIYNELVAHLVPNAHLVPAGIVAVSRAQEHGYTFAYSG